MPTKPKKILIIEDEKMIARALELKLAHAGFEVKAVFNGEEGIDCIQKETYALILLDLIMPKMDGFTVLQTLKDKHIETPVMVLSNLSQEDYEKRARALGAADFFIKSNTPVANIVQNVTKFLTHKKG